MSGRKKPEIGTHVKWVHPVTDVEHVGKVVDHLSSQFVIEVNLPDWRDKPMRVIVTMTEAWSSCDAPDTGS